MPDHDLRDAAARACPQRPPLPDRIVGGGYHGLLLSDRTKVPGLVSLYDLEPTVKALDRGEKPPLTSRPDGNVQDTLSGSTGG